MSLGPLAKLTALEEDAWMEWKADGMRKTSWCLPTQNVLDAEV